MHTENLTILFVDIAGFTATTNRQSRRQNASLLQNFESLLKPQIKRFSGQLVKSIGDALLLTFRSPTDAMLCACRMQDRLALHHQQHPEEQPIVVRIAAHLGEVRTARHDIFGEAVNLASRIEAVTPPGEIYLSEAVFLAMNKTEVQVTEVGLFQLEGFNHALHLYQVCHCAPPALPFGSHSADLLPVSQPALQRGALVATTVLLCAGLSWWFWSQQEFQPNLPTQLAPAKAARYVAVDAPALDEVAFSAEQQFGLVNAVFQAIEQVPGYYPADQQTAPQAAERIRLQVSTAVYPKPNTVTVHFQKAGVAGLTLEWQADQTEALLQKVSQSVVRQLGGQPDTAEPQRQLDPAVFQLWLKAEYQLSIARQKNELTAVQTVLQLLDQGGASLQQYRPAQRSKCSAGTLLYQLNQQPAVLEQIHPACQALTGPAATAADWLVYGQYQSLRGEFNSAEQALQQAIALRPGSATAYTELARLYQAANLPLEAERVYQQAVLMQPEHWYALQALAVFQLERGYLDSAVANFKKVIALLPQSANALTNLGSAYLLQGQIQAAADTYQAALELSAEASTQANLATIYYYLGRMPDAIRLYQQALLQLPDKFELHGNIADAYRQSGASTDANRHYTQALQLLSRQHRLDSRELALQAHYLSHSDLQQASSLMASALTQDNKNAEIWLLDAMLQIRLGQPAAGMASVRQALQYGFPAKLLAVEPDLVSLSNKAEFQKLIHPTTGR